MTEFKIALFLLAVVGILAVLGPKRAFTIVATAIVRGFIYRRM
jgi:hypothetical protein